MNADGTNARLLSTDPNSDRYGSWSPDGERVAFRSYRCCGGWPGLFVQDLESGRVKRLGIPQLNENGYSCIIMKITNDTN